MLILKDFLSSFRSAKKNENKVLEFNEIQLEIKNIFHEHFEFDFQNCCFSLDFYAIRHIFKNHGNPKTENSKGQIAIKDSDFELLFDILSNPDSVRYDGKNRLGKDAYIFEKFINGNYLVIMELRTKLKQLALNSMRIKIKKNRQK